MPKRKVRSDEHDSDKQSGLPPRRSTRPTKSSVPSGGASHGPSSSANNNSSHERSLSDGALIQEVSKMAANGQQAELMILELMRKYTFSFARLKELLRRNVQYVDIAPRVGLVPALEGTDIPTFEMFHARLPNRIIPQIVSDLKMAETQYRRMSMHKNEEARSRYISGYFNRIVCLFSGLLFNTPETIIEGRLATKGRIEYQFQAYGGITVVFIEVKLEIGGLAERLNFVAQVIAECDACARVNYQNGCDVPIMAILCDGKSFVFYKFVDKRPTKDLQFFLGQFPNGKKEINILPGGDATPEVFFRQLRMACDSLYYVFLSAYVSGIEAYWNRSVEMGKAEGKGRDSTPGWHNAIVQAKKALEEAVSAWNLYDNGELDKSEDSAERAAQFLAESIAYAPLVPESDFDGFSDGMERL